MLFRLAVCSFSRCNRVVLAANAPPHRVSSTDLSRFGYPVGSVASRGYGRCPVINQSGGADATTLGPAVTDDDLHARDQRFSKIHHDVLFSKLWSDDKSVVEEAFGDLLGVVRSFHFNAVQIAAMSILTGVMRKWHHVPSIQSEACLYLANSTYYSTRAESTTMNPIESASLGAVVKAMESNRHNQGVQRNGCSAMREMVAFDGLASEAFNHHDVHKLLIAAMKEFPRDINLQGDTAYALGQFAILPNDDIDPVEAIVEAGGRQALLDAIQNNPEDGNEGFHSIIRDLQEEARSALKKLL